MRISPLLIWFANLTRSYMVLNKLLRLSVKNSPLPLVGLSFKCSQANSFMFVQQVGVRVTIILMYVNDIILTRSTSVYLQEPTALLNNSFSLKDLGDLSFFLGLEFKRDEGVFIWINTNMFLISYNSSILSKFDGTLLNDPT